MIKCPVCGEEMVIQHWNKTYNVCTCNVDKIRKYWDKEKNRFATDSEINRLINEIEGEV